MNRFIGDRAFYKRVLTIAIPIIIQNGITNFVSLLDNIMVGRIGTEEMSGVAIINQLFFVFYLGIFGAISGAGIFTAQYVGQKNTEGVRHTLRFKLLEAVVLSAAGALIFVFFKDQLISLYLHEQGESIDAASTLRYGTLYLNVMIFGLLPFAVTQCYSGTLRECGETLVPMSAGVIAVCVNLFLNYVLIFGNFGAPVLGVEGAAIATVTSRMVELLIVVLWTHLNREKNPFAVGLYRGFSIPSSLALKILIMGTPLFLNEFFWSMGIAALTQCYSIRGLSVVAAFNISSTIINLFKVFVISMGNVVAIMIGQILGSGDVSHVVETDNRLIAFSIAISVVLGVIQFILAPLFPEFYNTGEEIKKLAAEFICIAAFYLPMEAFLNSAYFTIRSGGRTVITFIFDSVFLWFVSWPAAFILSRYTSFSIEIIYIAVLSLDSLKALIGFIMLKRKVWIRDLVGN